MTDLAKSLSKLVCVLTVKTGEDGKMFGAVTAGMIADQLKTQFDVSLDKKKLHLEQPIRALGEHDVELRLYQDVNATLKVRVDSTTPLAAPAAPAAAPEPGKEAPRTEKRGRRPEAAGGEKPARTGTHERRPRPPRGEKPAKSERAATNP